ncbi:MAG: aldo/keto reductase [Alphaproteobacteria bacterium]|nr:aldo/keto reductase [Alphaproteobacteria bacterium]
MKNVPLGRSGLTISQLGLGANRLLDPNEKEFVKTVNAALDRGLNFVDSAAIYGMGRSESFFGAVLGERRSEVVLASKCGIYVNDEGNVAIDATPDTIRRECDESLQRLNTDVIDLYYLHQVPRDIPLEDSIGTMAELVTAGKVRSLGICNCTADELRRAHAVHPMAALQTEYSLFTREPEVDLIPVCRELDIAFIAYGPLAYAFFGGTVRSRADVPEGDAWRLSNERFQEDAFDHNLALLDELEMMAADLGATTGQLSLAWLLAKGDDVIPIPGSRQLVHLQENLAAADIALSPEQVAQIDAAFPPGVAKGGARGGHSPSVANF